MIKLFFSAFYLSILLAGVSACTTPKHFWFNSTEQLIAKQHYQKAIEQLNAQQPTDTQQLLLLQRLSEKLRSKHSQQIQLLINEKKWAIALKRLNWLKLTQPHHPQIIDIELKIKFSMQEEQRLIATQMALSKANMLNIEFKQQDYNNRIRGEGLNWFNNSTTLQLQKQALTEELIELSTKALAKKDYSNAQKTYAQAAQFNKKLGLPPSTRMLKNSQSQQNNNAIKKRQRSLIQQLEVALAYENLTQVFLLQDILTQAPFHGEIVQSILQRAKKFRQTKSHLLDKRADSTYRHGDILQAIKLWALAHTLTPKHTQIKEKLKRARKVQSKLEKLKQAQEEVSYIPQ